jgi:hypothetical protein
MCISPKTPKLQKIVYPSTTPQPDAAAPMASPEDVRSTTAAGTRTTASRKSLRIDMAGGSGSGLNVPQG